MTRTIHKFQLSTNGTTSILLAASAVIIDVDEQYDIVTICALTDNSEHPVTRVFEVYGTGWLIESARSYRGTVKMNDGYVWHVFEVLS